MKNEYVVIHVFDASDEKEFKEKINGIIQSCILRCSKRLMS